MVRHAARIFNLNFSPILEKVARCKHEVEYRSCSWWWRWWNSDAYNYRYSSKQTPSIVLGFSVIGCWEGQTVG